MANPLVDALIWRESKNDPNAYNKDSGARGLGQIMPSVLSEYNKKFKTNYQLDDLFKPDINRKITEWHLTRRLPEQLVGVGIAPTLPALIAAYNTGATGLAEGRKPAKGYVEDILAKMGRVGGYE